MYAHAIIQRSARQHSFAQPGSLSPSVTMQGRIQNKPLGFVSALAHEVRNPLCNINLAVEMLNFTNLDGDQRQYLEIIMRGSGRIKDLIKTLLVSDATDEVAPEFYSLRQLLGEVLILAKDRIVLKNIAVREEYTTTEHRVLMDKEKMKIALANIVVNAIEAMSSHGGELRLVTRSEGALGTIEIQDNGVGISNEDLKKIFTPYFTNKPGGMGLGLSATLDILRANHAGVEVRSEEGAGTCFILSFDEV